MIRFFDPIIPVAQHISRHRMFYTALVMLIYLAAEVSARVLRTKEGVITVPDITVTPSANPSENILSDNCILYRSYLNFCEMLTSVTKTSIQYINGEFVPNVIKTPMDPTHPACIAARHYLSMVSPAEVIECNNQPVERHETYRP